METDQSERPYGEGASGGEGETDQSESSYEVCAIRFNRSVGGGGFKGKLYIFIYIYNILEGEWGVGGGERRREGK